MNKTEEKTYMYKISAVVCKDGEYQYVDTQDITNVDFVFFIKSAITLGKRSHRTFKKIYITLNEVTPVLTFVNLKRADFDFGLFHIYDVCNDFVCTEFLYTDRIFNTATNFNTSVMRYSDGACERLLNIISKENEDEL